MPLDAVCTPVHIDVAIALLATYKATAVHGPLRSHLVSCKADDEHPLAQGMVHIVGVTRGRSFYYHIRQGPDELPRMLRINAVLGPGGCDNDAQIATTRSVQPSPGATVIMFDFDRKSGRFE